MSNEQRGALQLLMSRQTRWPLAEPAPTEAELETVIDTALRVTDHGRLQPWSFLIVRGDARSALADVIVQAALARDPAADAKRFRAKVLAAPLTIVMAAHLRPGHKVPEVEQLLSAAAGAMNILNALHILGYGGFWTTGANCYDERVREALGFEPTERLIGFLYVGIPKDARGSVTRPARECFVREWSPAAVPAYRESARAVKLGSGPLPLTEETSFSGRYPPRRPVPA